MRRLTDERGAVAVIVALVVVGLFGMAAWVVDAGALYEERTELQNGADAAALALAEDCAYFQTDPLRYPLAKYPCLPGATAANRAETFADGNAEDERAALDGVVELDLDLRRVTVETRTENLDGTGSIAYTFARAIGFAQKTVKAAATASWGPPSQVPAVPITISETEYTPGKTVTLCLKQKTELSCEGAPGGAMDAPGAFGYLDAEDCGALDEDGAPVSIDTDSTQADPGNDGPKNLGCVPEDLRGNVVIPVYRTVEESGNNTTYRIVGFAAINVDAYKFTGKKGDWCWSSPTGPTPDCTTNGRWIHGTFTSFVAHGGEIDPTAPDLGVTVVRLVPTEELQ